MIHGLVTKAFDEFGEGESAFLEISDEEDCGEEQYEEEYVQECDEVYGENQM